MVGNLPHVFQDVGSLISQAQNLWSAQAQIILYLERVFAATRRGLYAMVVIDTISQGLGWFFFILFFACLVFFLVRKFSF
jgi:hypothetical protein